MTSVAALLEYHGLAPARPTPDPFLLERQRRTTQQPRLRSAPIVNVTDGTRVEHRADATVGICRNEVTWWRARTWT
jgi:hypothetical protein